MKKKAAGVILMIVLILGIITVSNAMYVVNPREYVAVREFGKIVKITEEPGLYFKVPFVQTTQPISAATKIYDINASDVITKDKKSMIADSYVLWEVVDPTKYTRTLNSLDARAEERIDAAVYNAAKSVISSMDQQELIESRGERLTSMITEDANQNMEEYGINIIKAEIKALDLPEDNKDAIYARMISERENIAAAYRAEGEAEAQKIKNDTDKQVSIKEANAKKEAALIEADGEAEYMRILQEAYNSEEKADFYNYIRSLDALKVSLGTGDKTIMLDKNSELARILYGDQITGKTADGTETPEGTSTGDEGGAKEESAG